MKTNGTTRELLLTMLRQRPTGRGTFVVLILLSTGMVLGHEIAELESMRGMLTPSFVGHTLFLLCSDVIAAIGGRQLRR